MLVFRVVEMSGLFTFEMFADFHCVCLLQMSFVTNYRPSHNYAYSFQEKLLRAMPCNLDKV